MPTALRLAVLGATGRTGSEVVRLVHDDPELRLVAALASPTSAALGRDVGAALGLVDLGVALASELDAEVDALVDFSAPAACAAWVSHCAERAIPFVSGTTGLDDRARRALAMASERIPVVHAPNMAPGASVLLAMVSYASASLGTDFDAAVVEAHHRAKRDAPSGTARALAGRIAAERTDEPSIASLRVGGLVGRHAVEFTSADETLTLSHSAQGRRVFARGAVLAARFVQGRGPGLHGMEDVLGLR